MHIEKMKPLRPSHKEKKRYIVIRAFLDETSKHLKDELYSLLGIWTSARAGIIFINQEIENNVLKTIIRVNVKELDKVRATLSLIDSMRIEVLGIKSTLKQAKQLLREVK